MISKEGLRKALIPYYINPENEQLSFSPDMIDKPIYGFYHIYAVNSWKGMFEEQINRLKKTGLLEQTKRLFISIIGTKEDADYVQERINPFGTVIWNGADKTAFEFPPLKYMYKLSQEEEFYCYYFHTKGVSYAADMWMPHKTQNGGLIGRLRYYMRLLRYNKLSLKSRMRKMRLWRYVMEYFCFDRWPLALAAFNKGYDTYGCLFYERPSLHYGGNFWWSKSTHIQNCSYATLESPKSRWDAEMWLLANHVVGGGKIYNAFTAAYVNRGGIALPRGLYAPTNVFDSISSKLIYLLNLCYAYTWRKVDSISGTIEKIPKTLCCKVRGR